MKYAHFKLKCMAVQVNKFQKLVQTQSILYLFHSLSTLIIQANDAWIQCCIIVNEYGAYSRATLKGVNTVSSIITAKGKVIVYQCCTSKESFGAFTDYMDYMRMLLHLSYPLEVLVDAVEYFVAWLQSSSHNL